MHRFIFFFLFLLAFISGGCKPSTKSKAEIGTAGPAMVISVSSDGRYVISSHKDKRLILWDIKNFKKQIISNQANIYSAFFVPDQEAFLWQDLENVVYLQTIDSKILQTFDHFPTYGHILSQDLKNYISSDQGWNIYLGHGENLKPIKKDGESPGFFGIGKLLNLSFALEGRYLLTAGDGGLSPSRNLSFSDHPTVIEGQIFSNYAGVLLWDISTMLPVYRLTGLAAKTTAALSPDGQRIVAGDEGGGIFIWETKSGNKRLEPADLFHGILNKNNSDNYEKWSFDKSDLIAPPIDFKPNFAGILALKFIDHNHYLRFTTNEPYAVLFHIDNPLPLKYLSLGRDPFPAVSDYSRNAAIDSAPNAGILVMGQQDGGGINVYKYDSATQALERVWVGE